MGTSKRLFCSIRKEWVAALPEEIVRQGVLRHMFDEKGFPPSLVSVEQPLRQLPHLLSANRHLVPNRRADIICFVKNQNTDGLHPLLIVECKSIKLAPMVMSQIVGYNHFVGSSFIALVNQDEIRTGWYDREKGGYAFVDFLPSYCDLIHSIKSPKIEH